MVIHGRILSRMLTLLSGSSIYRVSVTLEINGHPVSVDFHLRTSGGVDWSPYITPEHNAVLGQYFSTLDRVVYEKFLLLILEVKDFHILTCKTEHVDLYIFSDIILVLSIRPCQP